MKPKFGFFENVRGFLRWPLKARQASARRIEDGIEMGGLQFIVYALTMMKYVCNLLLNLLYWRPPIVIKFGLAFFRPLIMVHLKHVSVLSLLLQHMGNHYRSYLSQPTTVSWQIVSGSRCRMNRCLRPFSQSLQSGALRHINMFPSKMPLEISLVLVGT